MYSYQQMDLNISFVLYFFFIPFVWRFFIFCVQNHSLLLWIIESTKMEKEQIPHHQIKLGFWNDCTATKLTAKKGHTVKKKNTAKKKLLLD